MKRIFFLFTLIFLTSFTNKEATKKLPDGSYLVELDKKYKDSGLNDYEFKLENERFEMKIANKLESLEINWIDENSFIVKGYTEPSNPNEFEKKMIENYMIVFKITKQEGKKYYFTLGAQSDEIPIYSGIFVKVK